MQASKQKNRSVTLIKEISGLRATLFVAITLSLVLGLTASVEIRADNNARDILVTETTAAASQSAGYCIFNDSTSTIDVEKAYEVNPYRRGPHNCNTKFPGSFWDPRNGGECWRCPSGFGRTIFAVTARNACEKGGLFGEHRPATLVGKPGCPAGTWRDMLTDNCMSCPVGYKRAGRMRANLEYVPNACVAIKTFRYRLKPNTKACGTEFRSNPGERVKLFIALVQSGNLRETSKYCRWVKTEKVKTPKPTPALTPMMACPLFEFQIPANGSARVAGSSEGGFRLALLNSGGQIYDHALNGYTEAPAPGPVGRRRR